MKQPIIVGISGGTGAGKSTISEKIIAQLGKQNVTYIAQDSYYIDQSHLSMSQRYQVNYDHPDSMDIDLLVEQLQTLRSGTAVEIPIFEYVQCVRDTETEHKPVRPIIWVDGILLFHHPELNAAFDLKLYVDVPDEIRLIRRVNRDMERGMRYEDIVRQWEQHVRPMHNTFISPYKFTCDLIVPNVTLSDTAVDIMMLHLRQAANLR